MYSDSIKVRTHKCFKDKFEGFERILPINVIIGKNNSGKSTLIDLVESLCSKSPSRPQIYCEYHPTFEEFRNHFAEVYGNSRDYLTLQHLYKAAIENVPIYYVYDFELSTPRFRFVNDDLNKLPENLQGFNLVAIFEKVSFENFADYQFRRLNAERDIKSEASDYKISVASSGQGVTNIIQQFLNRKELQKQKLIRNDFLNSINEIVNPEIEFSEISVQISEKDSSWEICFEDRFGNNIFLSQMGSGIKTIILALVNLLLIPALDGISIEKYIFAFEELENNLHPSLQRKLYQFIKEFAQDNKCSFFITTHSNIGIDIFYNSDLSQLISVSNRNGVSTCKTIVQNEHLNDLLQEMGFKASDLLQTNGIIWVEGPSDRIYIKKWISLINENLHEGVHYSIMFYGGKLLSHLTFSDKELDEFILLLKINRNAYVVIDKDGQRETDRINKTKQRIQNEIGDNSCWVTAGREIENYLSQRSITAWLNQKGFTSVSNFSFGKFDKLESVLPPSTLQYNNNKSGYSKEIENFITVEDLNTFDLKVKIQSIVNLIDKWNS